MLYLYVDSKFSYCVWSQLKLRNQFALRCINLMRILVPLTNAFFVFKFLISKTMQLTFNTNLCGGKPLIVKEFKNSTGWLLIVIVITNYSLAAMICSLFTGKLIEYVSINQSTIIISDAIITESNILSESMFSKIFPYTSLIILF